MKKKSGFSVSSKYLLIGLTFFCFALIALSMLKSEAVAPVKNAMGYVLVPMQKGINKSGSFLYDKTTAVKDMWGALEENRELSEKLEALMEENNRLNEERYELERLRSLYTLDQTYLEYDKVGARVIGKDSGNWFHVFRIDKGSNDGIQVNMNVLAGGGLVGIVTDVGANYATVRSIIDDASNVGGMALSSSASCIVSGDLTLFEEGVLRLGYIKKDDVLEEDERIITSNVSDRYLPGILIGYARDIQVDSNNLTKSGYLVPVVDFDHLHEVLVITNLKDDGTGTNISDGGTAELPEDGGTDTSAEAKE